MKQEEFYGENEVRKSETVSDNNKEYSSIHCK